MWSEVINFFLPILATVLTVVLTALAKKWLDKMGIERSDKIDSMIDKYVAIGVESAEKLAANKLKAGTTVLDGGKKTHAVKAVLKELEQSGIKNVAEELIANRVEAYLGNQDPKESPGVS